MVYEEWRWRTAVLLLIIVTGAAGCGGASNDSVGTASQTTSQDSQSEQPAAAKQPAMTSGQKQALAKAQNYPDLASYSKKGLIEQLRDDAGYSKADATFAANNVEANWNRNAFAMAFFLFTERFSKDAMVRRLTLVERFTPAQARDAASKLYDSGGTASQTTPQDSQSEQPAAEKQPARTSGQKQALAKAQTDIDIGASSKKTLTEWLRRSEVGGYSKADATFAANNVEANWNWEAFQMASGYSQSVRPLSKDAVFWVLTLLDQFTPAQARYAVNKLS